MNKSTMIAAIFAASAFSAFAADVYSSNIVGYSKIDLVPGLTMVGAPFQAVGATGTINIQDAVDTTGLVGFDWGTFTPNDTLIIWDPATQFYSTTYYWSDSDPLSMGLENVWFDGGTMTPADDDLPAGSTFFISSATTTNIVATMMGEVAAAAAGQDIDFVNGLSMIANPFPYALDINTDMIPTGLVGFDWGTFTPNDTLIIWDPATQFYSTTYYWSDADPLSMGLENVWFDGGTMTPANATIPIGGAFFISSSGTGGTIDFAAP